MAEQKRVQQKQFEQSVARKAERKLRAREEKERPVWFGLGMFGLVGWAVAVLTLFGIAPGLWIDKPWPGTISWTLNLLTIGVLIGCLIAWYWVRKESGHD